MNIGINPAPCTQQQERQNWQILYNDLQELTNITNTNDVLEGYVNAAFTTSDPQFTIIVVRSYTGARNPGEAVVIENYWKSLDGTYLFSGVVGASVRAEWDQSSEVYRVDWVEC